MREACASRSIARALESVGRDASFALRLMRRGVKFYSALLVVLVGGIGAATAMFSIVRSLLLTPLPFPEPHRLTTLFAQRPETPYSKVSLPDFFDWKARAKSFERMAVVRPWLFPLSSRGQSPEGVMGMHVSGEFFQTYGVEAHLGRLLDSRDDRVGGPRVAVLSHALWRERFRSDPALVGATVSLNAEPYTIVGIAPPGFVHSFPEMHATHVWTPFAATFPGYERTIRIARDQHDAYAVARLGRGVEFEAAQAELTAIARAVSTAHPGHDIGVKLVDMQEAMVKKARRPVTILFAAVLLMFFLVCANTTNLLMNCVNARGGELAARAALGATSARLARQLVTETALVFLLAAPAGAVLAVWLIDVFALVTNIEELGLDLRLDGLALAFCVLLSAVSGLGVGLLAALSVARADVQSLLKRHATLASLAKPQRTASAVLVIAQLTVAFALVAASTLATKTFLTMTRASFGFDPKNVASGIFLTFSEDYADNDDLAALQDRVIRRLETERDVESVAMTSTLPLTRSELASYFEIEGRKPVSAAEKQELVRNAVTPGYFRTMRIPLLRGRPFDDTDQRTSRPVIIVTQSVAERFFPNQDPIGQRILHHGDDQPAFREIIGVVGDVRRQGPLAPPVLESYLPARQAPFRTMAIVVRSPRAPALLEDLQRLIAEVDPELPVADRWLMEERLQYWLRPYSITALALGVFALAAPLLASLGLYSVVAYATARRTRELGIRMALGASAPVILALVIYGGLRLVALGLAAGLVAAVAATRVFGVFVPGVDELGASTYLLIALMLGAAGLLACLVPAWRAVRISPANALRYE